MPIDNLNNRRPSLAVDNRVRGGETDLGVVRGVRGPIDIRRNLDSFSHGESSRSADVARAIGSSSSALRARNNTNEIRPAATNENLGANAAIGGAAIGTAMGISAAIHPGATGFGIGLVLGGSSAI